MLLHPRQPTGDRILLAVFLVTAFVGVPAVAGLDVLRLHLFPAPPALVSATGLMMFIAGWTIQALALRANAFAVTVVRHQTERRHHVVDTGPYRVVRHPMYAGSPLVHIGAGLWLGSYAAALVAVMSVGVLVARLLLEERFLHRELRGYSAYSARVVWRLIPGLW